MKGRQITVQILLAFGIFGCSQSFPAGKVNDATADPGNAFRQWWDPKCGAVSDTCDSSSCRTTQLVVFAPSCGPSKTVAAGCVPKDSVTTGWGCWVRGSDGTVIESLDIPSSIDGLKTCQAVGLTTTIGYYTPQCPDGGSQ
jgi:hypothetical protein